MYNLEKFCSRIPRSQNAIFILENFFFFEFQIKIRVRVAVFAFWSFHAVETYQRPKLWWRRIVGLMLSKNSLFVVQNVQTNFVTRDANLNSKHVFFILKYHHNGTIGSRISLGALVAKVMPTFCCAKCTSENRGLFADERIPKSPTPGAPGGVTLFFGRCHSALWNCC